MDKKDKKDNTSYISSKGYVIYKKGNEELVNELKRKLTVEPKSVPGYGADDEDKSFKLYRENDKKIYIPLHYGFKKVGYIENRDPSEKNKAKKINVPFAKEMREYQKDIIVTYMKNIDNKKYGGGIISVGCGRGKTVMALKIISELGYKTLILVHKEFLMNQWIERIEEFLPDARLGVIQGTVIDISNKDIVIGMIQSLSDPRKDKSYLKEMFSEFGLVVADECHHLGAKVFCRSLMKYAFKYTLGLSATPNRQDGLTKVFKYFLGEIVYKDSEIVKSEEELALEHIPDSQVNIIRYHYNHEYYNKEELNFRNKPNIIKMSSNIVEFLPRTKFILRCLKDITEKEPERNILILSARRNHIFDMEEEIIKQNIDGGSVGLYLGGMKQDDLNASTTKKIIIATFDMAEEAFDCKSLNTLILSTPKKNVIQAVGRILRQKKEERTVIPLVIDIHDTFSNFINWNNQREKYYKSKKYEIRYFDYDGQDEYTQSICSLNENDRYYGLGIKFKNEIKLSDYGKGKVFKKKETQNIKYEIEM